MAADESGTRLVTAMVHDCCPPAVSSPCYPGEYGQPTIIDGSVEATPNSDAVTAPTPDPTFQSDVSSSFDAPLTSNTAANNFAATAGATSLASTTGSGGGLDAPNMLGDSPGYGTTITISGPGTIYTIPNTATKRFKFTENISPIPQDRVFYSYSHFDGALTVDAAAGVSTYLDRHLFGGEKTFFDGLFSIELRMAVADGFDSDLSTALQRGGEFGNIQLGFKSLLYSGDSCLVGGGLTLSLPTADDLQFANNMEMENETVYLAPYLGFVSTPTENCFIQGVTQFDFTLGGDTVTVGGVESGVFQEQHLFYTSLSAGSWLYRDECSKFVNGVAAMTELHYTTALNEGDTINDGNVISGPGSLDLLNTTAGFVINKGLTNIRVAGSVPLDWEDRFYDSEFQVQINRRF